MKPIFQVFVLLILSLFLFISIGNACTIIETPQRRAFRGAKSVFIGKVIRIEENITEKEREIFVPKDWRQYADGKVTFEVKKNWKGYLASQKTFFTDTVFMGQD